jgi:hypothetical protein
MGETFETTDQLFTMSVIQIKQQSVTGSCIAGMAEI